MLLSHNSIVNNVTINSLNADCCSIASAFAAGFDGCISKLTKNNYVREIYVTGYCIE